MVDDTGRKRETTKINAALSLYGPSGAISTVENLTGLRIDHLAMVDWDGSEDITNALGGVEITTAGEGPASSTARRPSRTCVSATRSREATSAASSVSRTSFAR